MAEKIYCSSKKSERYKKVIIFYNPYALLTYSLPPTMTVTDVELSICGLIGLNDHRDDSQINTSHFIFLWNSIL